MIIQKRGLIVLFSFLFILLFSFFSQAANYEGLQLKKNNDETTYQNYDAGVKTDYGNQGWGWYSGNYCEGSPVGDDYPLPGFPPATIGCYVGAVEKDKGDDDCLYAYAKPGYIIYSHKYTKLDVSGSTEFGGDGAEDAANFLNWGWLINPGGICGDDHYWHTCDSTTVNQPIDIIDSTNPKDKTPFYCLKMKDKDTYLWVKANEIQNEVSVDQDSDSVPDDFDCAPKDDQIHPSFPEKCVIPPKDGKLKKGEVACLVEAAPEIAGNDIDENCDGKLVQDADDDKDSCEKATLNANNVAFFWMPDAQKGSQCCGDDPDDFGKIFQTDSGERLCLPNDHKLVVVNKDNKGVKVSEIVDKSYCSEKWCGLPAANVGIPFHIFTVKKPGQEAYDIVSNGEKWQECKGTEGTLAVPVGENAVVANGFRCYKEGERWSWVN